MVLVLPSNSAINLKDASDFAKVYRLPIRHLSKNVLSVLVYMPALIISSVLLRWLMWRDDVTTLIVNDFYLMQGPFCRIFGYSGKIYTWLRIDPSIFGKIASKIWLRSAFISSDKIIAVSRHIQSLQLDGIKTDLLYDALPELPNQVTESASKRFVYIANYIPGKGQEFAIEAFSLIAETNNEAVLDFYGGDMGLERNKLYRDQLCQRIATLRLDGRVNVNDFVSCPSEVMNGALAALNFSEGESFSMTVLEAAAVGLPVIATRSGGPSEIIEDHVTGMLVDIGNVKAMAAAMQYLVSSPSCARQMGRAARARVSKHFLFDSYRKNLNIILSLDSGNSGIGKLDS